MADNGGIGPRRLETFEEHDIISEQTVFYTYKRQSESRSRSQRRAASLGPGYSQDLDEEEEGEGAGDEADNGAEWADSYRGRDRIPRSASALPGTHDGSTWHTDGFSRRTSYDSNPNDSPGLAPPLGLEALSIAQRGPSPAYTPELRPIRSNDSSRRSSLRLGPNNGNPSREPILSPIASAAPSRAASDRTGSTSTERRFAKSPQVSSPDEIQRLPGVLEDQDAQAGPSRQTPRPILEGGSRRVSTSNVRFDDRLNHAVDTETTEVPEEPELEAEQHQSRRAASIRTNHSAESGSNASHTNSHSQSAYHPTEEAVQAISTASTPAPSRAPSIHARSSTEEPHAPITTSPLTSDSSPSAPSRPTSVRRDGRPSGLSSLISSAVTSPEGSSADLREVRIGRASRNGSATTIIINHEDTETTAPAALPAASQMDPSARRASGSIRPGPSRAPIGRKESNEDSDRGRNKFSFTAALRGLSQDVKDRVRQSSKSRTRAGSGTKSRTGSFSNAPPLPTGASAYASASMSSRSGSAIPPRLVDDSMRNGRAVSREVTPPGEFVPPFGAGGAGRARSGSRDREESPTARSQSRGRGRNKGMKALTGKFTIGDSDGEDDNEPVHHWKEFRKGQSS
jgi:hypothetical protein